MSYVLTPNMFLPVPGVGTEQGPDYAIDVNNCLTILDQHDHTPGSGIQITPAAININSDLTMATNNLTNIKMLQMSPQGAQTDVLSVYVAPGGESPSINDLWYNDSNGTAIQLTKQGLVNATLSSLPGESYSAGTFFWVQGSGSTTPANFDIGRITLRPNTAATTYGTTIQTNASLASSWTLTLPNNPSGLASNSFLTLDASGNMTAGPTVNAGLTTTNLSPTAGILGSQLSASAGIVGTQLANNTVTSAKMSNTGVTAGSYTNTNITVDAAGRVTAAATGQAGTSGTYTPSVSPGGALGTFKYNRIGNIVAVSGLMFQSLTPSPFSDGIQNLSFTFSLPIASNFTTSTQAAGAVNVAILPTTTSSPSFTAAGVSSNASTDDITVAITARNYDNSMTVAVSIMYEVL